MPHQRHPCFFTETQYVKELSKKKQKEKWFPLNFHIPLFSDCKNTNNKPDPNSHFPYPSDNYDKPTLAPHYQKYFFQTPIYH